MNYLVELRTAAGPITVGPFDTIDDARTWANGSGLILALLPATLTARQIITATGAELARMVKTWPENKSTKKLDKLPAIPYLRTTGIGGPQNMNTRTPWIVDENQLRKDRTKLKNLVETINALNTYQAATPLTEAVNLIDEAQKLITEYTHKLQAVRADIKYKLNAIQLTQNPTRKANQ